MAARIVIVSGACGAGKTSIARALTENSNYQCAVHLHTDDFYQYIRKGYIAPWLDSSSDQNAVAVNAIAASAKSFSEGGYEVYVDGVVGPWFLVPWLKLAQEGIDVRYIVLRPDEQTTIARALNRAQADDAELSRDAVKTVWQSLSNLGKYEQNAIDTTTQTLAETVAHLKKRLEENEFRLF